MWVDGLIRQYTYLHPEAHSQRMNQHIRAATQLSRTIAEIVTRLAETTDQVGANTVSYALSLPKHGIPTCHQQTSKASDCQNMSPSRYSKPMRPVMDRLQICAVRRRDWQRTE